MSICQGIVGSGIEMGIEQLTVRHYDVKKTNTRKCTISTILIQIVDLNFHYEMNQLNSNIKRSQDLPQFNLSSSLAPRGLDYCNFLI